MLKFDSGFVLKVITLKVTTVCSSLQKL